MLPFFESFLFPLFLCLSMASAFACGFSPSHWIVVKRHVFFSFLYLHCFSLRSPEPCTTWFVFESKISGSLTTPGDIVRSWQKATSLVSTCPPQKPHLVGISTINRLIYVYSHNGKLAFLTFINWTILEEMLSQLISNLSFHTTQFSLQKSFIPLCK